MKPIIAIIYYDDSYGNPQKEVVVYAESQIGPAIKGDGEWEFFDVHQPLDDIIKYGVDKDGFLYAVTASYARGVGINGCKIDGEWYKPKVRLK